MHYAPTCTSSHIKQHITLTYIVHGVAECVYGLLRNGLNILVVLQSVSAILA